MKETSSTYDTILDVAQGLVIAGGFNGFSYADIADAVGIRKASIHHHFPAKADLVLALVDRYRLRAEAGLNALREKTSAPVEQLTIYVNFWQACILDSSAPFCVCAVLAGEMQMLPPEAAASVRAHFKNLSAWLTSVLRDGVERKEFFLTNPADEEAQILVACVHGAMLSARAFDDPEVFGAIVRPQIARLLTSA
jgi:TetR/AcrR family transcriptional repressor of nem operon